MSDRACVDCRRPSPETQTQYTLISKYGWRVTRTIAADGETTLDWRCPACWAAYKARRPRSSSLPPPGPGASQPPPSMASYRPPAAAEQVLDQGQGETHAGRLFDRAIEALGSKPPRKD